MCSMPARMPARLDVILASEASRAVIIRRGPSDWARISLWHTDTDEFEHGQWLRGRIYSERCALSPDGSLFLYFCGQQHKRQEGYDGTWTALSKPPYLTALALWPQGDTWAGGGTFIDNRTIRLNARCSTIPHPRHLPPRDLRVISTDDQLTKRDQANIKRNQARGWQLIHERTIVNERFHRYRSEDPWIYYRAHPTNNRYVLVKRSYGYIIGNYPGPYVLEYTLRDQATDTEIPVGGAYWADWDQQGRLVYARDGQVFGQQAEQVGTFARPLLDLNDQTFENIPTPDWAAHW